ESANAVPGLQTHQADVPKQVGPVARKGVLDLGGIVVASHVVGEGDHSLAGKADAPGGDAAQLIVHQPPLLPMAVWIENAGVGATAFGQSPVPVARPVT